MDGTFVRENRETRHSDHVGRLDVVNPILTWFGLVRYHFARVERKALHKVIHLANLHFDLDETPQIVLAMQIENRRARCFAATQVLRHAAGPYIFDGPFELRFQQVVQ